MSQLQESPHLQPYMHSISTIPPPATPNYFSEREQAYFTLLRDGSAHNEALKISEYTRKVIKYLQVGMTKEDAHKRAIERTARMRDSSPPQL